MKNIDNYCVLPFRGMQVWTDGSVKPCCAYQQHNHVGKLYSFNEYDAWWTSGLKDLRQNFIDGDPPKSCSFCFNKQFQNAGVRTQSNWLVDTIPDYTVTQSPEFIDITFGNICNLKCIMCGSYASSRIESEYQKYQHKFDTIGIRNLPIPKKDPWWEDPIQIDKMVNIVSGARFVNFSGGEPLLAPALINLLEAIPKTCFVEINTNCTRLTDQHVQLFKRLHGRISISLDGIGAHHEYVRHESSWATIEKNIHRLLEINNPQLEIAFSYVLQHTSVYSFPNFWKYFKNFSNHIRISEVVPNTIKPGMMTINSVLPVNVDIFREWHKDNPTPYDSVINAWLDNYQFNVVAHENFKEYVTTLDEIRGCSFCDTFKCCW